MQVTGLDAGAGLGFDDSGLEIERLTGSLLDFLVLKMESTLSAMTSTVIVPKSSRMMRPEGVQACKGRTTPAPY